MTQFLNDDDFFKIDPSKSNKFQQLFERAHRNIDDDEASYNLECIVNQNSCNYQHWKFYFKGQGNFEGRQIGGTLKFRPNHPQDPPRFYFDPVVNGGENLTLQHENIYADGSLCLPMITVWHPQTEEYDILRAIEQIFHNSNWGELDAPANPVFSAKSQEEKNKIQQQQAKLLPYFKKNE